MQEIDQVEIHTTEIVSDEPVERAHSQIKTGATSTQARVKSYFRDTPIMYRVAYCESRLRQFEENGQVLKGRVDPQDIGVMQINERYHLKKANSLGYDIHTLEGNLAYAEYLYSQEGLQPWSASKPCWNNAQLALK